MLRDGDGLRLEDGGVIAGARRGRAARRGHAPTTRCRCCALAWHLGNRHLAAEIGAGRAAHPRRPRDRGHGLRARPRGRRTRVAPFEPEGGAYGHGSTSTAHDTSTATITGTATARARPLHDARHDRDARRSITATRARACCSWSARRCPVGAFTYCARARVGGARPGWCATTRSAARAGSRDRAARTARGRIDAVLLAAPAARRATTAARRGRGARARRSRGARASARWRPRAGRGVRSDARAALAWRARSTALARAIARRRRACCRSRSASPPRHGDAAAAGARRPTLHAFAANLVSAGVRLVPLGQTDGPARRSRRWRRIAGRGRARPRDARRSTTSAAARRAVDRARCGTRPSTRGCSAHEPEHMARCASASAARSAPARPR